MNYEARAAHAAEFAEEAEAVGIDPTDVVGRATIANGRIALFYTDPKDRGNERPPVYLIKLRRDVVLTPVGEPEQLDGFWDGANEAIRARLAQTVGPPADSPEGDA